MTQLWRQQSLLVRFLLTALLGTGVGCGLVAVSFAVGGDEWTSPNLWVVLTVVSVLVPNLLLFSAFLYREVVVPTRQLAGVVEELAREGKLEPVRERLAAAVGDVHADGRGEIERLTRGVQGLLASQEALAGQAQAIARDDLWSDAFERDGVRGDLAEAFGQMLTVLRDLSTHVKQIARGDFSQRGSVVRDGDLGAAFLSMTDKLQLLIEQLGAASAKIDGSARSLQAASRDQAASATQQAAAITETMATMEELAASSGHIADIAKNVVKLADESLESSQVGSQAVSDVGAGMDEIVLATQRGAQRLLDLGEKSRSIGKVADLITGIAEQSKFLALNAAIEAARAGEAGRGFSVVAEEVRNLANHVVESTTEIEGLIAEIQSEINAAMLASEEGVKRAERGRELASRAQDSLGNITAITRRSTDAARQIELATNQQRSASTQVATAVREVAGASEEVAKGAKRVTTLSNELAALAHDLQNVITTFESSTGQSGVGVITTSAAAPADDGEGGGETYDLEALRRG